jgi:glycosyltransferase involved in cell wall biosynthesis
MVHRSEVVITICQELQDTVTAMGAGARSLLIENVMGGEVDEAPSQSAGDIRASWGIAPDVPVALYTGTFEAYQGVELLIAASARLARTHPHLRLLVVGGEAAQVEGARARAASEGAGAVMVFTGQQPAREIPGFIQAADLLVSPRIRGTNTPLKIYSYLRSGRAIVATNLLTHTQVLTEETAKLVEPTAEAFAAGIAGLIDGREERARIAEAARRVAAEKYSREAYLRRTAEAYARLGKRASGSLSPQVRVHDDPDSISA